MLKYKMELMKRSWIYVLIGSIIIPACGGGQGARNSPENNSAMRQTGNIEIREIKRDLQQLDSTLTIESAKVKNLVAAVTNINNRVEEFDLRLLIIESVMISSNSSGHSFAQKPLSAEVYKVEYQNALQAFNSSRYDVALAGFRKLVNSNPNSELADNSQYWIGESYYGLKDYERALLEFEIVFTFPNNNKMDDAQIKLGICYLKLKNRVRAKEEFNRLIQIFPESEYISLSNQLISKL